MSAAKATKHLRAALYARYSTDKQREESLEDQYHVCEQVADREGFKVVGKFGDKEISGGTADRKGYQSMLDAARLHKFDVLIAEDISRLWRNRAEFGLRSAELEDLRVHMVTAVGDDTRRDGWGLAIQIKLAMAEHARREASYRTRRGLEGLAIKGKSTGGKAYGYRITNKVRKIEPEQATVVRRMYEWRAAGWSAQRIAQKLNANGVPPPGAGWKRTDTGPNRKNSARGWRPSAIAGDPARGIGILNNPAYKGQWVWGRSKWTRSAANSKIRTPEKVDRSLWITTEHPELRIVSDPLWNKVHAIQTAVNPRREAVRNGIAKKASGHGSKYWLGTLLVCGECGSNYMGDGLRDYICPAHTSGKCKNNLRFRREDVHIALFELLKEHLLSDAAVASGQKYIEGVLRERQHVEDAAERDAEKGVDLRWLDTEAANLRRMGLRPAALAAGLAEIDDERQQLIAKAAGRLTQKETFARRLMANMADIASTYHGQIQQALKVLAQPDSVEDGREAVRGLLEDGRITLVPNASRTGVLGPVHLQELGNHVLELAGWQRQKRCKPSGSGGLSWGLHTTDFIDVEMR